MSKKNPSSKNLGAKVPSPCIDVCKFRRGGHCIGCSMTKAQKSLFKKLKKPAHQAGFVEMLVAQQEVMGLYSHWPPTYARKCLKKGTTPPATLVKRVKAS